MLLAYLLSFVYLGIYWNNLLFWLSLVPFATGWMSENRFAVVPTAVYGIVLSFLSPPAGLAVYVVVALMWFVPDRRVERMLDRRREEQSVPDPDLDR